FFFQAEDGIRDRHVTGVQTCALPISSALAAGDAGDTWATKAPIGLSKPKDAARSRSMLWIITPSQPRDTSPVSLICSTTSIAISMGMAKDSPIKPPEREIICELIPTTSPFKLNKGPPELPGLMATSV